MSVEVLNPSNPTNPSNPSKPKPPAPVRAKAPARKSWTSGLILKFVLPLAAVAGAAFAVYHVNATRKVAVDVPPPIEPARAPYKNTVAGAGMIETETENISIGSPLPGIVLSVKAKVWGEVRGPTETEQGTELFRIDDRQLQQELLVRKAALAAAEADVDRLKAQPREEQKPVSQAQVREAEAMSEEASDALKRTQDLFNRKVATEQDLTSKQMLARAAAARLNRVRAEYTMMMRGAWEYDIKVAQAAAAQAAAQVQATEIELERLVVRSPIAGDVLQVNVRPGEFVGAPANQPLVIIGNLKRKHVRVDIDENDIPRFKKDRPAYAAVKGNADVKFPLTFVRVEPYVIPKKSLTGQNTERVDTRVLQVIYALPADETRVYVGQQVEVFIETEPKSAGPVSFFLPSPRYSGERGRG